MELVGVKHLLDDQNQRLYVGDLVQVLADEVVALDAVVVPGLESDVDLSFAQRLRHLQLDDGHARGLYVPDFLDIWRLSYEHLTLNAWFASISSR